MGHGGLEHSETKSCKGVFKSASNKLGLSASCAVIGTFQKVLEGIENCAKERVPSFAQQRGPQRDDLGRLLRLPGK